MKSYFDRLTDMMGAGFDSDSAGGYANDSAPLSYTTPTVDDLLEDITRYPSPEKTDALMEALRFAIGRLSREDLQTIKEILEP